MPLTTTGFQKRTLEEIKASLEARFKSDLGPGSLVGGENKDSDLNLEIAVMAEEIAVAEDNAEAIYLSQYRRTAVGESLDNALAYIGVERVAAAKSKNDPAQKVQLTGTDGTVVTINSVISVVGNSASRFKTTAPVTIGPAGGFPAGTAEVDVEAEEFGPVEAAAGTLAFIETPISGWNTATNLFDILPGRFEETDEEARIRAEASLSVIGAGTVDAIAARLKDDLPGVTAATVVENVADVADGVGRPPHSFEAVIDGGPSDLVVAQKIWDVKPAGIQTYRDPGPNGRIITNVVDQQGSFQTVKFSRPVEVFIRLIVNVTPNDRFPQDQLIASDEIKDRVVVFCGKEFTQGKDVLEHKILPIVDETPGCEDIEILLSRSFSDPPPVPTLPDNLLMAFNEKPIFSTTDVVVNII